MESVPNSGQAGRRGIAAFRRLPERWALFLPGTVLAASLVLRIAFWFRRDYNHDDFAFAYGAWLRGLGSHPGVNAFGFGFIFPLTEAFAPLFRWFPESFLPLDVARAMMLLCSCLLLFLVYQIAREFGGSPLWALTCATLASWQADFVLRIEDIRTDALGSVCLLGACLLLLRRREGRAAAVAGLLLGMAVTLDYKFAVAAPFVALAVVWDSGRAFFSRITALISASLAAPVLYFSYRIFVDTWHGFFSGLRQTAIAVGNSAGSPGTPLRAFYGASPWAGIVILAGALGLLAGGLVGGKPERRRGAAAAIILVFTIVFFRLNHFFFPYNFDLFAPLLATLLAGVPRLLGLIRARERAVEFAVLILVLVLCVGEGIVPVRKTLTRTNDAQKRLVRWVWAATSPSEHVFDWQGLGWGRPSVYHWWIFSGLRGSYESNSSYSLAKEWQNAGVTLMIRNYRFAWLKPADRAYLVSHYLPLDSCLLTPGRVVTPAQLASGRILFDPPAAGLYRVTGTRPPDVTLDGAPLRRVQWLSRASHWIASNPSEVLREPFALFFTSPLREAHARENPCPVNQPLLYEFN